VQPRLVLCLFEEAVKPLKKLLAPPLSAPKVQLVQLVHKVHLALKVLLVPKALLAQILVFPVLLGLQDPLGLQGLTMPHALWPTFLGTHGHYPSSMRSQTRRIYAL